MRSTDSAIVHRTTGNTWNKSTCWPQNQGGAFASLPRRGRDVEATADFTGGDEDNFGLAGDGLAFAGAGVPVEGVLPAFTFEGAAVGFKVADECPALQD